MLDKQSLKILKFFAKHSTVKKEQLINKFGEENANKYLNLLIEKQYVTGTIITHTTHNYFTKEIKEIPQAIEPYQITPKGEAYLHNLYSDYKKEAIKTIITVGLTALLSNIDRITLFTIKVINQITSQ